MRLNPDAIEPLAFADRTIRSILSVPSILTDQASITQTRAEFLMTGAFHFQYEVEMLRTNIEYGLSGVAELIEEASGVELVHWTWNGEWKSQGMCRYGPVYQVFLRNGLDLYPIKDAELDGLRQLVEANLISNRTYQDCQASYGR